MGRVPAYLKARDVFFPMKSYHYAVIVRPTGLPSTPESTRPDMESVDYKRQPDVATLRFASLWPIPTVEARSW